MPRAGFEVAGYLWLDVLEVDINVGYCKHLTVRISIRRQPRLQPSSTESESAEGYTRALRFFPARSSRDHVHTCGHSHFGMLDNVNVWTVALTATAPGYIDAKVINNPTPTANETSRTPARTLPPIADLWIVAVSS